MKKNCKHKNPLQRDGWSQSQRYRNALEPTSVQLDGRSTEDLLALAFRYSEHLNYFNEDNIKDEDWQVFFEKVNSETLANIESQSNNDPHLTLFLCFLKLFKFSQNQLNELTDTHLNFYYKRILQLQEKPETPDAVHLIFELAKNANQQMVVAGTRFKAGKDETGVAMEYEAIEDTLVNNAKVELMRTIRREDNTIFFAPVSNSEDGMGDEPIEEENSWNAFGHNELPISTPGFALSSPILELKEGTRKVTLKMYVSSLEKIEEQASLLKDGFEIYASGEEDWLGPFALESESTITRVRGRFRNYLIQIIFTIPSDEEAVIAFDSEILTGEFNSTSPTIRVLSKDENLYDFLEQCTLTKFQIEVDVKGIQTLNLENDFGKLDPSKPFMPFGTVPNANGNFYIGSEEVFSKKLKSFQLNLRWQNMPSDFGTYYDQYGQSLSKATNASFKSTIQILSGKKWGTKFKNRRLFSDAPTSPDKSILIDFLKNKEGKKGRNKKGKRMSSRSKRSGQRYRDTQVRKVGKRERVVFYEDAVSRKKSILHRRREIIKQRNKKKNAKKAKKKSAFKLSTLQKDGFIRMVLNKSFGHKNYPSLYAVAIAKKVDDEKIPLPNEPYTPTLESLNLDYLATTDIVSMTTSAEQKSEFNNREIQLFHLHPFGHTEEHPYLKSELPFAETNSISIFPKRNFEGEFFIGLKNIEPNQSVNLLLQLDEGSANPELNTQNVEWSVLSHNHWLKLNDDHFLADQTNQLLTSGIVKLILPKVATNQNTILDEDYYWLRVAIQNQTDAVAKFKGIHTQAVQAIFINKGNDPTHLQTALPSKTISKMVNRLAVVKKIEQPYDSFGGKTKESSSHYYTRVSERLRHKNRAISIWDFEHLVLEKFPEIYKVKCLNHTNTTNEFAPGNVYIIVIPELKNRNTSNLLKPKISANTLSDIENFLNKKCSMFTKVIAQNPDYEELKLEFDVAFHSTLEFGFYKNQLNEDIKKFLTPWAFDESRDIHFGGKIHKSILINFIDGLEYVDFISNFNMFHIDENGVKSDQLEVIETSSSRAILVSAPEHKIFQTNVNTICK